MTLPTAVFVFAVHVLLTLLPVTAAVVVAAAFGVKDRLLLLSLGLCGLAATGYVTFWISWASPVGGRIAATVLTVGLVITVTWLGVPRRRLLKELGAAYLPPTLLWVASSLLVFSFGALYSSNQAMTTTAQTRFVSWVLPSDNEIPLIVAHALQASHRPIPQPLYGVWHSSDRPPLQAGVYLTQEALIPGSDSRALQYETVGVLLQGFWIFGVWGLLMAVWARGRLVALVATAILFSGFTVVNTFYTWPKLFPASYLVLLAAMLLTPQFRRLRSSGVAGATAGALAGAALLGHEGSGLALLAFLIVMVAQRTIPSRRFLLGGMVTLVILQGTWMVYQNAIDPPGDDLARLQIAGQAHFWGQRDSLWSAIVDSYERTPLGTIVTNKVSNLETPFVGIPSYLASNGHLVTSYFMTGKSASTTRESAVRRLIRLNFMNLVPSAGFLTVGLGAWIAAGLRAGRRRTSPPMRLAGTIWVFLIANIVTWSLILFGPDSTVIHQGTYATELLGYTACVIGLWELSHRLCAVLVLVQASLVALLYGASGLPSLPANVAHHLSTQMLTLLLVSFALTAAALWHLARGSSWVDGKSSDELQWRRRDDDVIGDCRAASLIGISVD